MAAGAGSVAGAGLGAGDAISGADRAATWLTLAAFLTGAASFLYELGWIRMLSLVLGSSTHSFELMLSAFILGLAFGGLAVHRRIERVSDPVRHLGIVFIVMGALAALTLPAYNQTFDLMAWFLRVLPAQRAGLHRLQPASQLIAAGIMIPATFCAGMTLPLLTHALMRRGSGERAIGTVYAANTLGAIVGVVLAIHVLMPLIGVKGLILSGAGIHIALGGSGLAAGRRPIPLRFGVTALICLGAFLFALFAVRLDPLRMTSGVYRTGVATLPEGAQVRYLRDGKTATISVVEKNGQVVIATNGKPDAAIEMGPGQAITGRSDHGHGGGAAAEHAAPSTARRQHRLRLRTDHARAAVERAACSGSTPSRSSRSWCRGRALGLRRASATCSRIRAVTSYSTMPRLSWRARTRPTI